MMARPFLEFTEVPRANANTNGTTCSNTNPNTDTHNPNTSNTDAETARLRGNLRYHRLTGDRRAGIEQEEIGEG